MAEYHCVPVTETHSALVRDGECVGVYDYGLFFQTGNATLQSVGQSPVRFVVTRWSVFEAAEFLDGVQKRMSRGLAA